MCVGGFTPCNAHPVSFYVQKAHEKNLAQEPQWEKLLHIKKTLFSTESTMDSDTFFLAENGKADAAAELDATIKAFFTPVDSEKPDDHPQCKFPARFMWLNEELGFDKADLPAPDCAAFKAFKKQLDVYQTTLVYTAAYFGNPSSLFGHTLLRLDKKQKNQDMPLLSHYMTYGAVTGRDNGVAFALKGIFGGYAGVFTVSPYYDAVNLYNNMENRDLWEYRLTMTPRQTRLFVAHLWEAGHNYADYFFFSENCSYMLAQMLDVVYPEKSVAGEFYNPYFFSDYTIPADTVRAFQKLHPDAIASVSYRPSKQTKIKHAWKNFSPAQKDAFQKHVAKAPRRPEAVLNDSSLTDGQKAAVLETAYEYLHYNYLAENVDMPEMRADSVSLLKARNSLSAPSLTPPVPTPDTRPDQAHLSGAAQIGGGARNGDGYAEFYIRPALHTLADSADGMLAFSQLTYMTANVRWYPAKDKFRLQNLSFLDIQSVPPVHPLFKPMNFSFTAGVDSFQTAHKEKEGYTGYLSGGVGYALPVFNDASSLYAHATAHGRFGGYLNDSAIAGAGVKIGLSADFGLWRLNAHAHRIVYTQKDASVMTYAAQASASVAKRVELVAGFTFEDRQAKDVRDIRAGVLIFF